MIGRIVSEQNKVFTLFLAAALAMTGVLATASVAAAAAPTAQLAPISQSQPANWAALKTSLDHDASLSRTVTVTGGLRLLTYTTGSGTFFVLTEPTGQRSLAVKPNLGVVRCASWSFRSENGDAWPAPSGLHDGLRHVFRSAGAYWPAFIGRETESRRRPVCILVL